jgi:hypothetical protein
LRSVGSVARMRVSSPTCAVLRRHVQVRRARTRVPSDTVVDQVVEVRTATAGLAAHQQRESTTRHE